MLYLCMELYEKITKIMFDKSLNVDEFLGKTGFSKGTYYNIKRRDKKELKPEQAKVINDLYPEYSYEWLMGEDVDPFLDKDLHTVERNTFGVQLTTTIKIDKIASNFFIVLCF